MAADGERPTAIFAALAANLGIAVSKFVAFLVTRSSSMLAESIHSVADTSNQGLLLLGRRRAQRGATHEHPFGFGQERYFWSFVVAIVLFSVGALFSIFEGYEKFVAPEELGSPLWAVGVLVVAIVLEGISLRTAVREAERAPGQSWWRYVRGTKSPENAVVLLEDSAAEIGLLFALGGVGLAIVTHDARFDAAGSIAIGIVLAFVAALLAVEMRSLLLGETASDDDLAHIRAAAADDPAFERLVELRTMHLGPTDLLIALKVELADGLRFDEVAERLDRMEQRIRRDVPAAGSVFIEPETRGAAGDPGNAAVD